MKSNRAVVKAARGNASKEDYFIALDRLERDGPRISLEELEKDFDND